MVRSMPGEPGEAYSATFRERVGLTREDNLGHYLRGPSYPDGSARWMEPATLRLPAQGIAGPVCRVL